MIIEIFLPERIFKFWHSISVSRFLVWDCQKWCAIRKGTGLCECYIHSSRRQECNGSESRQKSPVSTLVFIWLANFSEWILWICSIFRTKVVSVLQGVGRVTQQANLLEVRFDPRTPEAPYWIVDTDFYTYSVVYSCADVGKYVYRKLTVVLDNLMIFNCDNHFFQVELTYCLVSRWWVIVFEKNWLINLLILESSEKISEKQNSWNVFFHEDIPAQNTISELKYFSGRTEHVSIFEKVIENCRLI